VNRSQFAHTIRAAAGVLGVKEVLVIGSQAVHASGYYAQGVEPSTAILPEGWRKRLIPFSSPETNGVTALCLELHDLWVSKSMAGRPKDREFCDELLKRKYVRAKTLEERLEKVKGQPQQKILKARSWLI